MLDHFKQTAIDVAKTKERAARNAIQMLLDLGLSLLSIGQAILDDRLILIVRRNDGMEGYTPGMKVVLESGVFTYEGESLSSYEIYYHV